MSISQPTEKKGHICPPSDATHPSGRWESLFIYSFICKFTNLRGKVEGLQTPMDLENALMSKDPNSILTQILVQFIVNLKPQARNLSTDQISTTVAAVFADFCKSSERTIFWDDQLHANVDPFQSLAGGFFTADWDFKLRILRQLVELQLAHAPAVKATIDRAWGVVHHKKGHTNNGPVEAASPQSQQNLQLLPLGQDCQRKRYWVADASPRVWVSTNPWKITSTFQAVSSTKDEYLAVIANLQASLPAEPKKGKRSKVEQGHISLIAALEARIEEIDKELARVQKARRKVEQKAIMLAQAELRQTRTRRQTRRPAYVYDDEFDEGDENGDDYKYQEDENMDEEYEFDDVEGPRHGRGAAATGTRRSSRQTAINSSKRDRSSDSGLWRGERRSARLGTFDDSSSHRRDRPKRARTEDSTTSGASYDGESTNDGQGNAESLSTRTSSAAALRPGEMALEALPGKRKSRFWVYAVEPVNDVVMNVAGGAANGYDSQNTQETTPEAEDAMKVDEPKPLEPEAVSMAIG